VVEGTITLDLETVQFNKKTEQFGVLDQSNVKRIAYWQDLEDVAFWEFDAPEGMYDVWMEYSHQGGGSQFAVEFGDQNISSTVPNTGNWNTYRTDRFGTLVVDVTGKAKLTIQPVAISNGGAMSLKKVELRPASGSRVVLSDNAWDESSSQTTPGNSALNRSMCDSHGLSLTSTSVKRLL
ncbi:MAG: hypothetical protein ACYTGL_22605, partial [Planctomycetota bacterium]